MGDRVWKLPSDQFVAAWNGSDSLDEAAAKVRETVGGQVPRWAVMARAAALRREGAELKPLTALAAVRS
jgi:hypothetical protein